MKRFWKTVSIENRQILLDGRIVKTPARATLTLPTEALAEAVKAEWEAQGEDIDPTSMPMTGLANAAQDHVLPDPDFFARDIIRYAETDLVCYRADSPAELVRRQQAAWEPVFIWAQNRYDVHFVTTTSIMHIAQPKPTLERLAQAVMAHDAYHLAALQPLVTISGSLVFGLAVLEGQVDAQEAYLASLVDDLWQEEQWGPDEWTLVPRANRERDFLAAARFLTLLV